MARVRPTFWKKQIDKLVQSENIPVVFKQYLNFGTDGGDTGYGFRDNAGTIQFKNSGGTWANLGPGGGGSDANFTQAFTGVSSVVVTHNLGKYPSPIIFDSAGDEVEGDIRHDSVNQLTVTFNNSNTGTVICN